MVTLTVNLTPPLTGVKGEMWIMFLVGGVGYWYKVIDIPLSVNGVIGPFGYADGYPFNIHQIRFPEQTIEGVVYEATETNGFTLYENWTFNVTLTPITPPVEIATTLTISAPSSVVEEEPFNVSGILSETDAGIRIPNQPINLSYNGNILGSANTDVDGRYLISANILSPGTYTLTAQFSGATGLNSSAATVGIRIGTTSIEIAPLLALLGGGLVLVLSFSYTH